MFRNTSSSFSCFGGVAPRDITLPHFNIPIGLEHPLTELLATTAQIQNLACPLRLPIARIKSTTTDDDNKNKLNLHHKVQLISLDRQHGFHSSRCRYVSYLLPQKFDLEYIYTNHHCCSSKRRKFVADGVFYAELNEFFQRELAEEGYSGVEVRVTPTVTDIIIRATHTQEVLGEQGRRIRELTSLIQKRFKFPENSVSLYAAKVQNRGLSAVAQCESLRYKLLNGLAVRRACYGVLRFIMESGAKGCEVVVSGKLRAARAKSMKFTDGFMIHSGQPAKDFIDSATRHVLLRQGVLGIKVKIMRGSDPEGKSGPQKTLPDSVTIIEPKDEPSVIQPNSQDYGAKLAATTAAAEAQRAAEQGGEGQGEATEEQ